MTLLPNQKIFHHQQIQSAIAKCAESVCRRRHHRLAAQVVGCIQQHRYTSSLAKLFYESIIRWIHLALDRLQASRALVIDGGEQGMLVFTNRRYELHETRPL